MTAPLIRRPIATLLAAVGLATLLGGCLEQNRDGQERAWIPSEADGYLGKPDENLSPDQRRALRERTGLQN